MCKLCAGFLVKRWWVSSGIFDKKRVQIALALRTRSHFLPRSRSPFGCPLQDHKAKSPKRFCFGLFCFMVTPRRIELSPSPCEKQGYGEQSRTIEYKKKRAKVFTLTLHTHTAFMP